MILENRSTHFIIIILECFFILIFFGILLPRILDYILYYFIIKPKVYQNSIFVYSIINKNFNILYNYTVVFNQFLKF